MLRRPSLVSDSCIFSVTDLTTTSMNSLSSPLCRRQILTLCFWFSWRSWGVLFTAIRGLLSRFGQWGVETQCSHLDHADCAHMWWVEQIRSLSQMLCWKCSLLQLWFIGLTVLMITLGSQIILRWITPLYRGMIILTLSVVKWQRTSHPSKLHVDRKDSWGAASFLLCQLLSMTQRR